MLCVTSPIIRQFLTKSEATAMSCAQQAKNEAMQNEFEANTSYAPRLSPETWPKVSHLQSGATLVRIYRSLFYDIRFVDVKHIGLGNHSRCRQKDQNLAQNDEESLQKSLKQSNSRRQGYVLDVISAFQGYYSCTPDTFSMPCGV